MVQYVSLFYISTPKNGKIPIKGILKKYTKLPFWLWSNLRKIASKAFLRARSVNPFFMAMAAIFLIYCRSTLDWNQMKILTIWGKGGTFQNILMLFFSKIYTVFIILCFSWKSFVFRIPSFASTKLAKDALRKIPAKQSRHSQLLTDYLRASNWHALFYVKPCILLFTFKSFHKEAE